MTLACISKHAPVAFRHSSYTPAALVIPAAYHSSKAADEDTPFSNTDNSLDKLLHDVSPSTYEGTQQGLLTISRGTAMLLLIVYVAYLFFQVRLHNINSMSPFSSTIIA